MVRVVGDGDSLRSIARIDAPRNADAFSLREDLKEASCRIRTVEPIPSPRSRR